MDHSGVSPLKNCHSKPIHIYSAAVSIDEVLLPLSLSLPPRFVDALKEFDSALTHLRENLLIDYKQLGLQYKLYTCEVSGMIHKRRGGMEEGGREGSQNRKENLQQRLYPRGQLIYPKRKYRHGDSLECLCYNPLV